MHKLSSIRVWKKRAVVIMCLQMCLLNTLGAFCQVAQPASAPAASGGPIPSASRIDVDLGSTSHSVTPSAKLQGVTIVENGVSVKVGQGQLQTITPAERLAAYQVASTGQQSLVLNSQGAAIGGFFDIGPKFSQYASSLNIPKGVVGAQIAPSLDLTGNLTNSGSYYAYTTSGSGSGAVNQAAISASNLVNNQGAVLSTSLPASVLQSLGLSGVAQSLNLSIAATNVFNAGTIASSGHLNIGNSATQNVINAGTITSAGNLSIMASNSVTNALVSGITGPAPVMQAHDINIVTANLYNQGSISAQGVIQAIATNASNQGTMQALSNIILGSSSFANAGKLIAGTDLHNQGNVQLFDGGSLSVAGLVNEQGAFMRLPAESVSFGKDLDNQGTLVLDFSNTDKLHIAGSVNNNGNILALSFNSKAISANVSVGASLSNASGAFMTTVLPQQPDNAQVAQPTASAGSAQPNSSGGTINAPAVPNANLDLTIEANGLNNAGVITSSGGLVVKANDNDLVNSGAIVGKNTTVMAKNLNNTGQIYANGEGERAPATVSATTLTNGANAFISMNLADFSQLGNSGTMLLNCSDRQEARVSGELNNSKSGVILLYSTNAAQKEKEISLSIGKLTNGGALTANVPDTQPGISPNTASRYLSDPVSLDSKAKAQREANAAPSILSNAVRTLKLNLAVTEDIDNSGSIAADKLQVSSKNLNNSGWLAGFDTTVKVGASLTNSGSILSSPLGETAPAEISAGSVDNQTGGFICAESTGVASAGLTAASGSLINKGTMILHVSQNSQLSLGTLKNSGGIFVYATDQSTADKFAIIAKGIVNEDKAFITSRLPEKSEQSAVPALESYRTGRQSSRGTSQQTSGTQSYWGAQSLEQVPPAIARKSLTHAIKQLSMEILVNDGRISNRGGSLESSGDLFISASSLDNFSGSVQAPNGSISVQSLLIENAGGTISAKHDLSFQLNQAASASVPTLHLAGGTLAGTNVRFIVQDNPLSVHVDRIYGNVSAAAGYKDIETKAGDIHIVSLRAGGDGNQPAQTTVKAGNGSVIFEPGCAIYTAGGDFTCVAAGNIGTAAPNSSADNDQTFAVSEFGGAPNSTNMGNSTNGSSIDTEISGAHVGVKMDLTGMVKDGKLTLHAGQNSIPGAGDRGEPKIKFGSINIESFFLNVGNGCADLSAQTDDSTNYPVSIVLSKQPAGPSIQAAGIMRCGSVSLENAGGSILVNADSIGGAVTASGKSANVSGVILKSCGLTD